MYRVDYHLHTAHSMDCDMPMRTLCETALAVGLDEICITDHTEFGHPDSQSDRPPVMEDWFTEIAAMREAFPALRIRSGIEIGDNPLCRERIKEWHFAWPLDFRLLSLHLIGNEDPYFADFFEDRDQSAFYQAYVEAKLESALHWSPDEYEAFAHLGYCGKFAPYPVKERPLRHYHAPDHLDTLFRLLAEGGKALEINTSGMRTMDCFIPGEDLLRRFHELGGEFVTIGSDAHYLEFVGKWTDDARALAKDCGFRYLLTFDQRKPIPIAL